MVRVEKNGYWVHYPNEFTESGNATIVEDAFIQVGGVDFVPQALSKTGPTGDWLCVCKTGSRPSMPRSGMVFPLPILKPKGMKPKITFSLPVTFLDASQEEVRFPVKTNQLLITLGEKLFGLRPTVQQLTEIKPVWKSIQNFSASPSFPMPLLWRVFMPMH